MSEIVVRTGCPFLPNRSQKTTGDGLGAKPCMPICSARASSLGLATPACDRPDRSPFTSDRNTGTPAFENPSARICNVTVFPVPVAPAINPCLFENFKAKDCGVSPAPTKIS